MKKTLLLLLTLLFVFTSSACSNSTEANAEVAAVSVSYGKPIELAKEEFETIFAEYECLEIIETATLDRTDEANNVVVQITYTSDNGDGVYGFEFAKDSYGNWEILQQGEDALPYLFWEQLYVSMK